MERDMELIRKILLIFEEQTLSSPDPQLDIQGYSSEEVHYHLLLLKDAGFVAGREGGLSLTTGVAIQFPPSDEPFRLTWDGHEFLDAARDPTRFQKALKVAKEIGGVPVKLLRDILTSLAKEEMIEFLRSHS